MRSSMKCIAIIGLVLISTASTAQSAGPRGTIGPDMTFCQLYDLEQYGRLDDIVGMAIATTSWNVGDEDLMWFAEPNEEHPFIVSNLYRKKADRFEQIGQSWVKHGFFALANTQCGGDCDLEPGHPFGLWLGVGCTDTYDSDLNASQGGLGPRYEINPWTGEYVYEGSHLDLPSHPHNGIEHRLQVHDADIDPAQNAGAIYYVEGYYAILDDVNVMNSASWKTVTFSGSPGGTWAVSMSGAMTQPTIGFAIDAWDGATKTTLAQIVPPVEFVSPDGRCILAAKTTDLGDDKWHYEYALYNIDMDRKVGSFSLPIAEGAVVSNVGFHAVESHDEPYSNDPWMFVHTPGSLTWSTPDNPLRWGTLYNFRFDANVAPITSAATLGHYEPGAPASVSGSTTGPSLTPPDCNDNGFPDDVDTSSGASEDCNGNSAPDECEVPPLGPDGNDCNANGTPDDCELIGGNDCNADSILDACQLEGNDCNSNFVPDECDPLVVVLNDNLESGVGWSVVNIDLDSGAWELADPEGTMTGGNAAQPEDDHSVEGTLCFVTSGDAGTGAGSNDVDGGPTQLTTPSYDLSAGQTTLEYAYWFFNDDGDDALSVEVSVDDGANWIAITSHFTSASVWRTNAINVADVVETSAETRFRFFVSDNPNDSITEAAIDDLVISLVDCTPVPPQCDGDVNGDGSIDPLDYGFVLARFGCAVNAGDSACDSSDANQDGGVDPLDAGYVAARFGDCG